MRRRLQRLTEKLAALDTVAPLLIGRGLLSVDGPADYPQPAWDGRARAGRIEVRRR